MSDRPEEMTCERIAEINSTLPRDRVHPRRTRELILVKTLSHLARTKGTHPCIKVYLLKRSNYF